MASFVYKAFDTHGGLKSGSLIADSAEAAVDKLYGAGLTPIETHESSGLASGRGSQSAAPKDRQMFRSDRFGLKELTGFTVELASLMGSGLSIDAALRIIGGPGAPWGSRRLCEGLLADVLGGAQLSEAMAKRPGVFPPEYVAVLSAGEAGGALAQVLKQLSELLTKRLEIRNKIYSALIYPTILVVMSLVSVAVIIGVLIPTLAPIFTDSGLPLPGVLKAFADLQENWIVIVVAGGVSILLGAVLRKRLLSSAQVVLMTDRLKLAIPVTGRLVRVQEAGRFARALGTLLVAGVPLMAALQTARRVITNTFLAQQCQRAIDLIPEGAPMHEAFAGESFFPIAALRLIAVGEESGRLGHMLTQVASVLETDFQKQIERMVGLLTPVMTLLIGGGIGTLIMQVMTAVLSINDLAIK